jgi:hypothetical protein
MLGPDGPLGPEMSEGKKCVGDVATAEDSYDPSSPKEKDSKVILLSE